MSGPYCKTCEHFWVQPITTNEGYCDDPTKIISFDKGDDVNSLPWVTKSMTCMNHQPKEK